MAPIGSRHRACAVVRARSGDGCAEPYELLPCRQDAREAGGSARLYYCYSDFGSRPGLADDPLQRGSRDLANDVGEEHRIVRGILVDERYIGITPAAFAHSGLE